MNLHANWFSTVPKTVLLIVDIYQLHVYSYVGAWGSPPPPRKIYTFKLLNLHSKITENRAWTPPPETKLSLEPNPTPPLPPPPQFLDMKYRYNNSIMYFFLGINAFPIPIIKVLSSQPIKICMASINLLNNGDQTNVELKVQCFNQTHSLIILTHFLFS